MPQPGHDQLPRGAFVILEPDALIDILDAAALSLGLSDLAVLPTVRGQLLHARQHSCPTSADGDETNLALCQLAQASVSGRARVKQQTGWVVPCLFFPIVSKPRHDAVGF